MGRKIVAEKKPQGLMSTINTLQRTRYVWRRSLEVIKKNMKKHCTVTNHCCFLRESRQQLNTLEASIHISFSLSSIVLLEFSEWVLWGKNRKNADKNNSSVSSVTFGHVFSMLLSQVLLFCVYTPSWVLGLLRAAPNSRYFFQCFLHSFFMISAAIWINLKSDGQKQIEHSTQFSH